MEVTIETNAKEVTGVLARLFRDQMPFAMSKGANRTALTFQREQRQHQHDVFEVRRPRFVDRAVKIKPFAKKSDPVATVRIDPPGGQQRANILTKFETDTVKYPFSGSTLAVPIDVPRTGAGVVSKPWRPNKLGLKHVSGRVSRGDRRTFAIRDRDGGGGYIFRRMGRRGNTSLRLLYVLVPKVPIEADLDFIENARRVVNRDLERNLIEAFDHAVRTAR